MAMVTHIGQTQNIFETTNFLHRYHGGTIGQLDRGYGFPIIGPHEDYFNITWITDHLEGLSENRE